MKKSDKKIFATLFFSMFTAITGVGIVVPLLPVYAHDMGAGGLYIGMIFGAFSVSRTFFLPYFGRSSDKKGRKPYIVAGLFAYTLISFSFILATHVEILIAIRFVQGIASAMIMPVVQAYIGDITPEHTEGATMGFFNLSVFFGLSLGPLIGGVLKDHYSLNFPFVCMGILSFLSFFLSLFQLPPAHLEQNLAFKKTDSANWGQLLRDRDIKGLFLFRFAYTACIGIIWSFLPLFADIEFSLPSSSAGVLVTLGVFVSGVIQTPMGFLADRTNKKVMLIIGGILVNCAMLSYEWSRGFWDLFFAGAIFGLGGGIAMAPHTAMTVQKGSKSGAMGAVMGLMTMAHSMGMMAGALLAGMMMDIFELRQAFTFGACIMVMGLASFFGFTYQRKEAIRQF